MTIGGKDRAFLRQFIALALLISLSSPLLAEDLLSPRLNDLRRLVTFGDKRAERQFWEFVETEGTPLVEERTADDRVWLTFLWHGDDTTRSVSLFGVSGADAGDNQLQRLAGTDVWFKTYIVRTDLRMSYQLAPNQPAEPPASQDENPAAFKAWLDNLQPDPNNRHPFGTTRSSFALAKAPDQPWIVENPDLEAGLVEKESDFHSDILNNDRDLWIYLPPNYRERGEPHPVVLLFDASAYLELVPTPIILDNLIAAGRLPPVVTVLIGNSGEQRNVELPCNDAFAEFLATELIPWVRSEYNITDDPRLSVIGGSSYGGLAASFFAMRHPELISNVLSQSGSYWWAPGFSLSDPDPSLEGEWLTRQYALTQIPRLRFYLDVGWKEGGNPSMLVVNRHFRNVLEARGHDVVQFQEFNGGHDYLIWRGTLADGLIALLGTP